MCIFYYVQIVSWPRRPAIFDSVFVCTNLIACHAKATAANTGSLPGLLEILLGHSGLKKQCGWLRGRRYPIHCPKHFMSCSRSRWVHHRRRSHRDSRSFDVFNSAFGSDQSRWREPVNVPRSA
ncbi:hypothetical protein PILCRDRAFT_588115 [Piloderma croceum F 1598]|uniref:Uncharacterized protein n=1 Tax=Piloderma croceum (strain F 1598) TaxID=765440 RepID=A0A0C3AWQ9_PILCF|nr:hypothetical protein PILCRDRAFT_588115 [Piloderma croceum F 1598]